MQSVQRHLKNLFTSHSGLLDVFLVDFVGLLATKTEGDRFLLVQKEHLTSCPFVWNTKNPTASVVIHVAVSEIIP